jgi:hypothetical protein
MTDEQGQQERVAGQDQDKPDESEPNDKRQEQLRANYDLNMAEGRPPYDRVWIETLGELNWILQERQWSGEGLSGGVARPDLRGASLVNANLSGARLFHANLCGAYLNGANLSRANLSGADLSSAYLLEVNLSGTDLVQANLTDAALGKANLSTADLRWADLRNANLATAYLADTRLIDAKLEGTDFTCTNLSGADLRRARMDSTTLLREVKLSPSTRVADVVWNGVPLTEVNWGQAKTLGDEQLSKERQERPDHKMAIAAAARAYRGLSIALRSQGLLREASGYRIRELRMERAGNWAEQKFGAWSFSLFLDAVSGYGERLGSTVLTYVLVVVGFAGAYWLVTHFLETKLSALTPDEALILSLTSFHGRGFFPGFLSLGDWVARLGAVEAVIGLVIEIILIATFTRRFLGN